MRAVWVIFALAAPICAWAAPRFELPEEKVSGMQLKSLAELVSQQQWPEVAKALESLLKDHADDMAAMDEESFLSPAAWFESLGEKPKAALTEEYRSQFEQSARAAMEAMKADPRATAAQFCSLARRYAPSSVVTALYLEAADRAAHLGDYVAAADCFALAEKGGWKCDAARLPTLAVCRVLNQQKPPSLPADLAKRMGELSSQLAGYRGDAASDAPWYGRVEMLGQSRHIPFAADGIVYFAGARHVLAAKENGQIVWRWAAGDTWASPAILEKPPGRGRGPIFAPAAFCSAQGPQIIVVRQPRSGARDYCLRAIRASDGKLLWNSEAAPELSIASNPAVAGAYVYAVAVDFSELPARLVLVAFHLLDGRPIFRTPLGTMLQFSKQRTEPPGFDSFWDQSEPGVADDTIVVTPNVGVAFGLGRFDGRIRWVRIYFAGGSVIRHGNVQRPAVAEERQLEPQDAAQLLRWRGTPQAAGGVIVIAPQDLPGASALNIATGQTLWTNAALNQTIIGRAGSHVLLAGASIVAIDPATGKTAWRFDPPAPVTISGPPTAVGANVFVPLSDFRILALSAETGKPISANVKPPNMRQLVNTDPARKALQEALILRGTVVRGYRAGRLVGFGAIANFATLLFRSSRESLSSSRELP